MAQTREVPFRMEEIFDYMGVDYLRYARNRDAFNIPCPKCDSNGTKHHLNVNLSRKKWRCPKCGSYGDGVNYYALVTKGDHRLSAAEYAKLIDELTIAMKGDSAYQKKQKERRLMPEPQYIKSAQIAADEVLDHTFRTLLSWPPLALTEAHKEMLLTRGLDEEAIESNGYKSLLNGIDFARYIDPAVKAAYGKNNWGNERKKQPRLKATSDMTVMAGLTVAYWLKQQGCTMKGVPGFFKFQGHWCFLFPGKGIAIPTRNREGQIVCLQARMDKGNVRYLTISAKGLELGVSEHISRVHWPLANDPVPGQPTDNQKVTEVLITEGPLKADVALHLLRKRGQCPHVAFAAIQGVLNTNALMTECEELVKLGYKEVTNALDMDRLTNINVMNGAKRLRELLSNIGLKFRQMFWDESSARELAEQQRAVCLELEVPLPAQNSQNPYLALARYTKALADAGHQNKTLDWPKKSKGIDDFLYSTSVGQ